MRGLKSLFIIWFMVLMSGAAAVAALVWITTPAGAVSSDKYDGNCATHATVGRCADKCPATYTLQGHNPTTGAAICVAPVPPDIAPAVTPQYQTYQFSGK